ncbi:hypothetical protein FKM82_002328 [Ascaphus truei]
MEYLTTLSTAVTNEPLILMPNVSISHHLNTSCIHDGLLSWILPVMYSFICGISLLSNTMALLVFWSNCQKCTSMIIYMRNLAVADLLLSLCLPLRVAYQNNDGPLILCKIIGAFFYLNMYASIMFLSLISLDRYLKIIKPLQTFKIHSTSWSTKATRIVWIINLICIAPFLFEGRGSEPCNQKCFHFRKRGSVGAAINLTAVIAFFILLLLFVFFYAKISAKLYKASLGRAQPQMKRNSNRAITKSFIVLVIFIVCFVPYHIVRNPLHTIPDRHNSQHVLEADSAYCQ